MMGWSAWYEGTPEMLSAHYMNGPGNGDLRPRVRPSQLDGGIIGALARFWWGQPQDRGSQTRGLHLPLAADIATASADLLFGETLDLDYGIDAVLDSDGNTVESPAVERLEYILEENSWDSLLSEAGELQSALGGVYLRAGWDDTIADCPLISVVSADKALPEFRYGRLQAVTFWEIVKVEGARVWRHLERHEMGHIFHQLHLGSYGVLGGKVSMDDFELTKGLLDDVTTGIKTLTVEYVPNVRPARRWRNVPEGVNLGRADIDGTEPMLDSLDETWNSLMRDIRHGKSRLLVSSAILHSDGPGKGASVDLDRSVYEALNVPIGQDAGLSDMISAQQFPIRVEEHLRTIEALMGSIVRSSGYSAQTFGMDTAIAKTATEVDSVRDRTRQTREKKTRYWQTALQRLLRTVLALDVEKFKQKASADMEVHVEFPPEATPDSESTARTLQMLRTAEVISLETAVQLLNPGWDDAMVAQEVERIRDEKSASTPSFGAFLPDGSATTPDEGGNLGPSGATATGDPMATPDPTAPQGAQGGAAGLGAPPNV